MLYKYNDMTDHDIDVTPGDILEELNNFNCDYFEQQLEIAANFEKKHIMLKKKNDNLEVKIKFFELEQQKDEDEDEEEEQEEDEDNEFNKRLRMKLIKKRGDLSAWYDIFNKMRDTVFADLLQCPE